MSDAIRELARSAEVVIVGGGLAGLFCALKLAPRPVTVISAAPLGKGASTVLPPPSLKATARKRMPPIRSPQAPDSSTKTLRFSSRAKPLAASTTCSAMACRSIVTSKAGSR
jgi:glycine/D-amino acid oxidase-like deaminating enzyme